MNKLIPILLILSFIGITEPASAKHHSKVMKRVSSVIRFLPLTAPPPAIPVEPTTTSVSFKETCALIALSHKLEESKSKEGDEAAIQYAWDVANKMEIERQRQS